VRAVANVARGQAPIALASDARARQSWKTLAPHHALPPSHRLLPPLGLYMAECADQSMSGFFAGAAAPEAAADQMVTTLRIIARSSAAATSCI